MALRKSPTLKSSPIKVGLTIGDPSGVGPAITLKAVRALAGSIEFTVIGDAGVLKEAQGTGYLPAGRQGRVQGFKLIDLHNVKQKNFSFGQVKAEYGRASLEYLDQALQLVRSKEIDCLVTCPVSKEAVNKAGIKFSGHTEYLASRTKTKEFAMLLLNKELKISLLTRHIPLNKVSAALSKEKIYKNILLTYQGLRENFQIKRPRLVVCGLNPHASDNGLIGDEENMVIKPVLKELRKRFKMVIDGPFSAEVALFLAANKTYDCAIASYHDQALIPLKLFGFDTGVNLTLGLPFVRTSPLHGTAFDIAGQPALANPRSLIEAIKLAVKCSLSRRSA